MCIRDSIIPFSTAFAIGFYLAFIFCKRILSFAQLFLADVVQKGKKDRLYLWVRYSRSKKYVIELELSADYGWNRILRDRTEVAADGALGKF